MLILRNKLKVVIEKQFCKKTQNVSSGEYWKYNSNFCNLRLEKRKKNEFNTFDTTMSYNLENTFQ